MANNIYISLPVTDLARSIAFYKELGFDFDERYTDENTGYMIYSDNAFIILMNQSSFEYFSKKPTGDAHASALAIHSIELESPEEVDSMIAQAEALGAKIVSTPEVMDWMYQSSFEDPDGHIWEVFCMDEAETLDE